jgi:exopolysaccharide transport family protein
MLQNGSEAHVPILQQRPNERAPVAHDDAAIERRRGGMRDLVQLFRLLRRHLRVVIATPIILIAIAIAFVTVVKPLYTATATVLIDPRRATIADPNNQAVLSNFGTDDATTESQVMLTQSIAVLRRVVDSLKLTEDQEFKSDPSPIEPIINFFWARKTAPGTSPEDFAKANAIEILQKRLKVARQRSTFLADISVTLQDPAKAAQIANAIADASLSEQVRSKYEATKIANTWLDRQIAELKARVLASDKAVADFRAANNLIATQGATVNDQQLTDLNNKLIDARAATAEARAKYEQARTIAQRGTADAGSLVEALSSNTITQLRAQYGELTKNAADLTSRYGPRHPLVIAAQAQVRNTDRLINEEVQRILESRRQTFEAAATRESSLQESLDALQTVSTESGQAQIRLRELQREADANRALYESFLSRYKETGAQESLEMPDSRLVTRAQTPVRPSYPKTFLIVAVAAVLGLGLGCAFALLNEFLDPRIKTPQQAETATGIPSIAAVPIVGLRELAKRARRGRNELSRYDPKLVRLLPPALQPPIMRYATEEPISMFAEAVRAVRLAVQNAANGKTGQITMITSAMDGEGKTTLATNLAFSFATMGLRTILVESDLRNPELTRSLCPRVPGGLVEVAMGQLPLHQAILVDRTTNLSILPAPSPKNRALLANFVFSDAMGIILDELRRHYDMIIIDAPPLIPLVDGRALGQYADHIVLATHWGRTPQDLLVRALDHLHYVRDRVLGTVLTLVDFRQVGLYDHYYQSSHYRPYDFTTRPNPEVATQ